MYRLYEGVANERRELWREELDLDINWLDAQIMEWELNLHLDGLADPREYVLGGRVLLSDNAELNFAYLEARRRGDPATGSWLPGVELSLISTLEEPDDPEWDQIHTHVNALLDYLKHPGRQFQS